MADLPFRVGLDSPKFRELDRDVQIAFHAMNKSGSEAASNVLYGSYRINGMEDRFFSHFRTPMSQDDFIALVDSHEDGGLFMDHYLYGWIQPRPKRVMLTQFRHPLPRILSVYNWLKVRHEKATGKPFKSIVDFVRGTKGTGHCMVVQLGTNWKGVGTASWSGKVSPLTAKELYERSLEALEREIYAIGIAEYFEESVFLYAKLGGLAHVLPWVRDNRNPGRPLSTEVSAEVISTIEEVLEYDFKLYKVALDRFWAQFEGATFGPELDEYKACCLPQYKDRQIIQL